MSYLSGSKLGAEYRPDESAVRARSSPVSMFLIVICAFGTTAPEASVMVPLSVAPATCAYTGLVETRMDGSKSSPSRAVANILEIILSSILPPLDDRNIRLPSESERLNQSRYFLSTWLWLNNSSIQRFKAFQNRTQTLTLNTAKASIGSFARLLCPAGVTLRTLCTP